MSLPGTTSRGFVLCAGGRGVCVLRLLWFYSDQGVLACVYRGESDYFDPTTRVEVSHLQALTTAAVGDCRSGEHRGRVAVAGHRWDRAQPSG